MPLLFAATLFISALLLFWIQPLIAKMLLPLLGGTPAVWNTCMLFFQSMLLGGYLYALLLSRWFSLRQQTILHIILLILAALSLPVNISQAANHLPPTEVSPALWLLGYLLTTIGPPLFAISANSSLLQKWFSQTPHRSAKDPYFLYAASNAGSLVALIAFPLLLEPGLKLQQQSRLWTAAYGALVLSIAACALSLWRARLLDQSTIEDDERRIESVTLRRRLRWMLLAFIPSSLVLGVTTHISTDIAATPLLWIIPLSLYLLSFILVFAKRKILSLRLMTRIMPAAALVVTLVYVSGATEPSWFLVLIHLIFFFVAAMVCHGQLAEDRPSPVHLAEFYFWLALGGVAGGLFNALVAPLLFSTVVEYPLMIVAACLVRPRLGDGTNEDERRARRFDFVYPIGIGLFTAALALIVMNFKLGTLERTAIILGLPLMLINHLFTKRPVRFALGLGAVMIGSLIYSELSGGETLYRERNFYGTLRVTLDPSGATRRLHHGSTIHGRQFVDGSRRCEPLSYYHPTGPLGSVFISLDAKETSSHIAVIGLGTGATLAYAHPNQKWTFYEIDPAVLRLAQDGRFFSYLKDCAAQDQVEIVLGDARLQLQKAAEGQYKLIILDAFSSDAVPVHLLTKEALDLYLSKLSADGLIAFHVSNRSLNLNRVVGDLAKSANLVGLIFTDEKYDPINGKEPSEWAVVARRSEDLGQLVQDNRWKPLEGHPQPKVWTDDFSNIISVLRW